LNEYQYAQVRTKAFKDWFGDWENNPEHASKVVDENGEPLVVYHGTNAKFDTFKSDTNRIFTTVSKEQAFEYGTPMEIFVNAKNIKESNKG
jgi:hypothetical protein